VATLDSERKDGETSELRVEEHANHVPGAELHDQAKSGQFGAPELSVKPLLSDSLARLRQVFVQDVGVALPETFARVILRDLDADASFTVPVSLDQASQIAAKVRSIEPPRPLSHQLFSSIMLGFDLRVEYVAITGVKEGNFTAEVTVSSTKGARTFEARASDAILMALLSDVPVPILADLSLLS